MAEEATEKKTKKGGVGRTILKLLLWLVGLGLALVLLVVATSPLWLGPLAKGVANSAVPQLTGCEFSLEELSVNPFTGRVFLRECHLKNPEGYKSDEAFSVATVVVDVAIGSLGSDEIHIETVEIRGLYASYLSDAKGSNNFDRIIAHATGGGSGEKEPEEEKVDDGKAGPRVVIDHFELTDSKVSYGIIRGTPPITLPIPSVVLNDIGKEKEGGVSFSDAFQAIWEACLKAGGSAGDSIRKLGGLVGDGAAAAAGAVGDAAGAAAGAVGDAAGKAADAAGKAVGAAADAAGDAVKSIGNLFKGGGK